MDSYHLFSVFFSLFLYSILITAFYGWGKFIIQILGLRNSENRFFSLVVWIGWAINLFFLQIVHFFLPISAFVIIFFLSIGIVIILPQFITSLLGSSIRISTRSLFPVLGLSIFFIFVIFWISSRSMLPPTHYDSGLYHFNKIRWINTYPIVPGLGNLHGRLAFNQTFFLFVAALNFFPLFEHGHSIANSFIFLLTFVTFLELLWPVYKKPSLLWEVHPFRYLSIIFAFPILGYLSLSFYGGLSSPSPDLTSTLLLLVIFIVLIQGLGEWINGKCSQNDRVVFLGVLSTLGLTIKMSNLAFCSVIWGFIFLYILKQRILKIGTRIVLISTFTIIIWCLYSLILSGAPFFPSTIGYISFEWSVPKAKVIAEAQAIQGWGRQPGPDYLNTIGNWQWLEPWLKSMLKNNRDFIYSLAVSLVFCLITFFVFLLKEFKRPKFLEWIILFPPVIGLLFWFFSAPGSRFVNGLFYILSICSALLFLKSIQAINKKRFYLNITLIVFLIINYHSILYGLNNKHKLKSISYSGWHSINKVPLDQNETLSGLLLYIPKSGDQCWDSPLPCTPYYNKNLMIRTQDKLSSGFLLNNEFH